MRREQNTRRLAGMGNVPGDLHCTASRNADGVGAGLDGVSIIAAYAAADADGAAV